MEPKTNKKSNKQINDISDVKNNFNIDTNIDTNIDVDLEILEPSKIKTDKSKKISNHISETTYKRPILTYTDKLSKQQVKELLIDYEQIKSIQELQKISQGTHLRYFEYKNDELLFRTGGIITVNSGLPAYLILSSGKLSWSVQVNKSIFFKRITIKQVRNEFQKDLLEKDAIIVGLHEIIREKDKLIREKDKLIREKNIIKK